MGSAIVPEASSGSSGSGGTSSSEVSTAPAPCSEETGASVGGGDVKGSAAMEGFRGSTIPGNGITAAGDGVERGEPNGADPAGSPVAQGPESGMRQSIEIKQTQ